MTTMKLQTPCCNSEFLFDEIATSTGTGTVEGYECLGESGCVNFWDKSGNLIKTRRGVEIDGYELSVYGHPDELDGKAEHLREMVAEHGFQRGAELARPY